MFFNVCREKHDCLLEGVIVKSNQIIKNKPIYNSSLQMRALVLFSNFLIKKIITSNANATEAYSGHLPKKHTPQQQLQHKSTVVVLFLMLKTYVRLS